MTVQHNRKRKIRTGLLIITLFLPSLVYGQLQKGLILSTENDKGIGFVNIGIIGKNVGTVSDEKGNFSINLDKTYDNDSIRFSMIGFESRTYLVSQFKEFPEKNIYLKPVLYKMQEVKVIGRNFKEVLIGIPVPSGNLISGFAFNDLGAELGINVNVKKQVKLLDINFNMAKCTFDSVTYRLNVYQLADNKEYINILHKPIYISFPKDSISKAITLDLKNYSIFIEGNVLITLELYKDFGEGDLLLFTDPKADFTWHKKTSEGQWTKTPGAIGMYLNGLIIK